MRKLVFIMCSVILWSCGDNEEVGNVNNNLPPNPPSLIIPSNNTTIVTQVVDEEVYFEWTQATDPDNDIIGYRIWIDTDPNFSNPFHHFTEATNTTSYLQPNNWYYWRVTTRDSNNNISDYSQIWSFYLENGLAPTPPTLIFPQNETECANDFLTFQWNESTDPNNDSIEYTLLVSTNPSFSNNVDSYNTNSTDYTLSLPESTALYWKVEASNGTQTSVSQGWSLYVQGQGTNNTVPNIEYIYPEDDAIISDQSPPLQWQANDNETSSTNLSYKVYFSEVGQDLELVYEDTDISNYEVSGLDFGTTYQWSVWVTDEDGATNVGEVYRFTVD